MLEYLPQAQLAAGLRGLRALLSPGGSFLLFMTRRNWLSRPLIGVWWQSNLYAAEELRRVLLEAGFTSIDFRKFPPSFRYLALWGHVIEARN
jgi:hypothetical protein